MIIFAKEVTNGILEPYFFMFILTDRNVGLLSVKAAAGGDP